MLKLSKCFEYFKVPYVKGSLSFLIKCISNSYILQIDHQKTTFLQLFFINIRGRKNIIRSNPSKRDKIRQRLQIACSRNKGKPCLKTVLSNINYQKSFKSHVNMGHPVKTYSSASQNCLELSSRNFGKLKHTVNPTANPKYIRRDL